MVVNNDGHEYYDSLGGSGQDMLTLFGDYLVSEHEDKLNSPLDLTKWTTISSIKPHQENTPDSGIFIRTVADAVSCNRRPQFKQKHIPHRKRKKMSELLAGQLLIQKPGKEVVLGRGTTDKPPREIPSITQQSINYT